MEAHIDASIHQLIPSRRVSVKSYLNMVEHSNLPSSLLPLIAPTLPLTLPTQNPTRIHPLLDFYTYYHPWFLFLCKSVVFRWSIFLTDQARL